MDRADSDDLLGPLLATFAAEAAEHLQAMNRHLLSLERGADDDSIRAELFREAHSMKGAARAVSLAEIEGLAHDLEDIFAGLCSDPRRPGEAQLEQAYQTLDAMQTLVEAATAGGAARNPPAALPGGGLDPLTADPAGPPPRPQAETVRVATAKLDALLASVGELLVVRVGMEQRLADVLALDALLADCHRTRSPGSSGRPQGRPGASAAPNLDSGETLKAARASLGELRRRLDADIRRMQQVTADLQDDVRRTRMVPATAAFEVFPRMVRDLASDGGKQVILRVEGGDTEVDRSVLEQIKDPLTHLLRNSIDHGIESPQLRAAAGKPPAGTICLSARRRDDMLVIEVEDDGTGIDPARVRAAAVHHGLLGNQAGQEVSDHDAIPLIFRSGLSTSPAVTGLSGRGVGLDVVRVATERLHGSIDVRTAPGRGTTFVLALPLSISTMHCLLLEAGGQAFALPAAAVDRVLRVPAGHRQRAQGRDVVGVNDQPVPLARLTDVLGIQAVTDDTDAGATRPAAVLTGQGRRVALLVDRLSGTHQLVIKSLPAPLSHVRHVAAAAILGTGEVAMILNVADLVACVRTTDPPAVQQPASPGNRPATVLVVEDSITTRTLEKNLLEAAGYQVQLAADGEAGWDLLRGSDCDLVVADIEMPRMDGYELTAKIRADARTKDLPVVLVTSRDSEEDRERGLHAGADAYIVKGGLDQNRLLDTIRRLI